jgi:hypothetical protein
MVNASRCHILSNRSIGWDTNGYGYGSNTAFCVACTQNSHCGTNGTTTGSIYCGANNVRMQNVTNKIFTCSAAYVCSNTSSLKEIINVTYCDALDGTTSAWGSSYCNAANTTVIQNRSVYDYTCRASTATCEIAAVPPIETRNISTCAASETCRLGACVPKDCTPGDIKCSGITVEQCTAAKTWITIDTCNATEYLDTISCTCKPGSCTAGDIRCTDCNHYETCNPYGSGWGSIVTVPSNQRCDSTFNPDKLVATSCTKTTDKQCVGTTQIQTCDSCGQWGCTTSCDPGKTCDSSLSPDACVCGPTSNTQCDGSNLRYLDSCGQFAGISQSCTYNCYNQNNYCDECSIGTTKCSGAQIQTCRSPRWSMGRSY